MDVCCHAKVGGFLKMDLVVPLLLFKYNDLVILK